MHVCLLDSAKSMVFILDSKISDFSVNIDNQSIKFDNCLFGGIECRSINQVSQKQIQLDSSCKCFEAFIQQKIWEMFVL